MCSAGWPVGFFETYFAAWFVAMDCLSLIRAGQSFFFFFQSLKQTHTCCALIKHTPNIYSYTHTDTKAAVNNNMKRLACKNSCRNVNTCKTQSPPQQSEATVQKGAGFICAVIVEAVVRIELHHHIL